MELPLPAIIIGIGGAGARIARLIDTSALDTLLISSSANDLAMIDGRDDNRKDHEYRRLNDGSDGTTTVARIEKVLLNTGVLNPSPYTIRGSLLAYEGSIRNILINYRTFIMVANLAGRNGVAVAPLLADMIKANADARLVTFAIMPFGFESDRLFRAGVALKKLSERSDCTIVVDNDSFLANNPDLSVEECYRIANGALLEAFNVMMSSEVKGLNMLSTGIDDDGNGIDVAAKDAVRMLYSSTEPDRVRSALLYIIDGGIGGSSIGLIDSLAKRMGKMLGHNNHVIIGRSTRGLSRVYGEEDGVGANDNSNVHSAMLLAEVTSISKFDSYDPLGILPREFMLDWECSESEIRLNVESMVALPNLD